MRTGRGLAAAGVGIGLAAVLACTPAPTQTEGDVGQTDADGIPRTADGRPDLQGIWTNKTQTPLQRPAGAAEYFTEEEAEAYVADRLAAAARPLGPNDVGSYNDAFFDRAAGIVATMRTSLVIDPPDGRVPAFTPDAQARFDAARARRAAAPLAGPESRNLTERCILFGAAGPPMFPEPYNSNYQIVQTANHVQIVAEMNTEVRIIPLDGSPHHPETVQQWVGDSRGQWDGDTLVIETRNLQFNDFSRFGVGFGGGMTDENLVVTERFEMTDPDFILYQATIDDPTVYTEPWTVEVPLVRIDGPIFEFACHEGNYGLLNILEGARVEEAAGQ